MKYLVSLSFLIFYSQLSAQIEIDSFTIEGISNYSQSFKIRRTFGAPKDSFQLDYECGFLSSEWQGETFWCLEYEGIRFAGNQNMGFVIEKIDSNYIDSFEIMFYRSLLETGIDEKDFREILFDCFKRDYIIYPGGGTIISFMGGDDGITFYFRNHRLIGIEYFDPC